MNYIIVGMCASTHLPLLQDGGKNAKKSSGPKTKGDAFLKRLKRDLKKTGGEKLCSITYDEETDSLVVGLFQRNKAKTLYVDVEE